MGKKLNILLIITALFSASGCVKETYDMGMLSKKAHLSPTFAVTAVRGNISFSDLVEPSDTVIFDSDNFVRLVFKKDSVINFKMEEYYDLNDMVSFSQDYPIGPLTIAPFSKTISYTLDQISQHFSASLRSEFVALDGTVGTFPPFPVTNMGETSYSLISNFESATFKQGAIDISVTNNLTAPIYGVSVKLFNTAGHTQIGGEKILTMIDPGETADATIDLANLTISNSISVVVNGSPGAPVAPIHLNIDNVEIAISGRDLMVKSGRAILPLQTISTLDDHDTIPFDPGPDVQIGIIKMNSGDLSYSIHSSTALTSNVSLTLPTALRSGAPLNESFSVNPNSVLNGAMSVDNSVIDLGSIVTQPYNLLPVDYDIKVGSNGTMINFSSSDKIRIDFSLHDPDFDYVKGYFGQKTETIDPDTLDLEIKDILDHISGTFLVSDPSIKMSYSNSFALPVKMNFQATGVKGLNSVNLGLNPVNLSYPAAPAERDKEDEVLIDKTNSSLPQLVSMPPEKIRFSGSALMNPGGNDGSRNNYLFSDSRFNADLEIEIPMELRIDNLQFADTVDNFLKKDNPEDDSPVKAEDFEFMRIDINAKNGFPLGVTLSMTLYNSGTQAKIYNIDANDIISPAPVDNNGKVTGPFESKTSIDITREFWESIDQADKIIFTFKLNSTGNGSEDVKIYSDYKIDFKASVVLKPDIKFDLK
jgi:hypothetical protein